MSGSLWTKRGYCLIKKAIKQAHGQAVNNKKDVIHSLTTLIHPLPTTSREREYLNRSACGATTKKHYNFIFRDWKIHLRMTKNCPNGWVHYLRRNRASTERNWRYTMQ